jgi:hypothetical protein
MQVRLILSSYWQQIPNLKRVILIMASGRLSRHRHKDVARCPYAFLM